MAEPTVPVPVSLIERAAVLLEDYQPGVTSARLRALLSQPTPTAEPVQYNGHNGLAVFADAARRLNEDAPTAEPPRIEDMAPGTIPCADPNVNRWYCQRRADGTCPLPKCIDPSTIRDVRPPAVTP